MKVNFFAAVLLPAVTVFAVPAGVAQQPAAVAPVSAPIPAPILSAQKVFLANGGADAESAVVFEKANQVEEPYNSTYAALQAWGHWQLVSAPENSDLVLVVRFTAPADSVTKVYAPQIELTILDSKTHFPLWTLTQPVAGAFREATWKKNYAGGITEIVAQLKALVAPAAP